MPASQTSLNLLSTDTVVVIVVIVLDKPRHLKTQNGCPGVLVQRGNACPQFKLTQLN